MAQMNPIAVANRIRRNGGGDPTDAAMLRDMCESAAQRGEIGFDQITVVFRHLAIHAGVVRGNVDFYFCPVCGEPLNGEDET